jgi:hypothetical protein
MSAAPARLAGWTPFRIHESDGHVIEWCWMDGLTFDEPFFADTVERALRRPFSLLFPRETPMDALDGIEPGLEPNGFLFHASRSGSTLIAGLLASVPQHLVLSEPLPVDGVLRARATEAERVRWLRGIVAALGRLRRGDERAYVVKLDAWSIRSFGLVRRAFPHVPCAFIFRDPLQILVSHFRGRGAHMVPGAIDPGLFGLDAASVLRMPPEEYCARVLASIYRSALDHRDDLALLVDYRELPDAVFDRILAEFGLECDAPELARMRELAAFDAKEPRLYFNADSEAKEATAAPALRAAVDRWARPVYEELLAC